MQRRRVVPLRSRSLYASIGALRPTTASLLRTWQEGGKIPIHHYRQRIDDLRERTKAEYQALQEEIRSAVMDAASDPEAPSEFLRWLAKDPPALRNDDRSVYLPSVQDHSLREQILQNPNLSVEDAKGVMAEGFRALKGNSYFANGDEWRHMQGTIALISNPAFQMMLMEDPALLSSLLTARPQDLPQIVEAPEVKAVLGEPEVLTFKRASVDKKTTQKKSGVMSNGTYPERILVFPFVVFVEREKRRGSTWSQKVYANLEEFIATDAELPTNIDHRRITVAQLRAVSDQHMPELEHKAILEPILQRVEAACSALQRFWQRTTSPDQVPVAELREYVEAFRALCQAIPKRKFFAELDNQLAAVSFPVRSTYMTGYRDRVLRGIMEAASDLLEREFTLDQLRNIMSPDGRFNPLSLLDVIQR